MPKAKQPASSQSSQAGPSGTQAPPALSQTQSSQAEKAAEKAAASLGNGEITKKADELVQYLLVMDQKKLPIKKLEINKVVLKEAHRAFPIIMKKASERLTEVFGIEVVELQDKLKGSYALVNTLGNQQQQLMTWPEGDNAKTALLTVVLSIIYMSGNVLKDGELWHGLKNLGINPEITHETFGDIKRLVTQEFVRQGYLEVARLPNTDQPVFEVRWGQRARLETSKMQILNFVSMIYEKGPEQWTTQYEDAKEDS